MKMNISAVGYDDPAERHVEDAPQGSGIFLMGSAKGMGEGKTASTPYMPEESLTQSRVQALSSSEFPFSSGELDVLGEDPWDWSEVPR